MPAKKDPPLTDEERSRRIRELADEAGTSDDPAAFDRAFDKVTTPDQNGVRTGRRRSRNRTESAAVVFPASLERDQLRPGKDVVWRLTNLVALVGLLIGNTFWLHARRETHFFSFEPFEGDGSAARIEGARSALEKIIHPGSAMAEYGRFFRRIGGHCATVADTVRFPNSAVCSYKHGFLVSAEWKYVVVYDPSTLRGTQTSLHFGLTGL